MFLKVWKNFRIKRNKLLKFSPSLAVCVVFCCLFKNNEVLERFWKFLAIEIKILAFLFLQFECPYCHRILKTRQNVQRHILTHTGEKPFQCPKCPYACTQKTHLGSHMARIHGISS